MPTPTADVVLVRTQIIEKLLAGPTIVSQRYQDSLGTNAEFQVKQELTDNILLTDEVLCADIINSPGNGWRQQFMVLSGSLVSGQAIPKFIGAPGDVKVKVGSAAYKLSKMAKNREEVLSMIDFPSLYESKDFHWIEDGIVYTPADFVQIKYPSFTRGTTCQSPQTAEPALIYGALQLSEKVDSDGPFFQKYGALFQVAREFVKSGEVIPPQAQLEKMIGGTQ